jgi:hypothetical protein
MTTGKTSIKDQGASDQFMNVHLGTELRSFIVADLGNRANISCDLPRDPPLESAHFTLQSASSRINQRLLNGPTKLKIDMAKPSGVVYGAMS